MSCIVNRNVRKRVTYSKRWDYAVYSETTFNITYRTGLARSYLIRIEGTLKVTSVCAVSVSDRRGQCNNHGNDDDDGVDNDDNEKSR